MGTAEEICQGETTLRQAAFPLLMQLPTRLRALPVPPTGSEWQRSLARLARGRLRPLAALAPRHGPASLAATEGAEPCRRRERMRRSAASSPAEARSWPRTVEGG